MNTDRFLPGLLIYKFWPDWIQGLITGSRIWLIYASWLNLPLSLVDGS